MLGYIIEIPIGNILGSAASTDMISYIIALHKFAVILAAILAVIFMMIGGFLWLASAGNSGMVSTGQNFIKGSVIGLILTLFSWYILYAINPNLVKLSITEPKKIEGGDDKVICCQLQTANVLAKMPQTECILWGGTEKPEIPIDSCPTNCAILNGDPSEQQSLQVADMLSAFNRILSILPGISGDSDAGALVPSICEMVPGCGVVVRRDLHFCVQLSCYSMNQTQCLEEKKKTNDCGWFNGSALPAEDDGFCIG